MLAVALAASLAFTQEHADLAYATADAIVTRCTPRDAGTLRSFRAAYRIRDAAGAAGADARLDVFTADTPRGPKRFVNVEGEIAASPDAPWIVIVSHYDTKPGVACPGANDGASTSGLLVALADAIATARPKGANFAFLWTDGEESMEKYGENDGLWGSKRAAAKWRASGREVHAVVCLDMLGDRDLKIGIPANCTEPLRRRVLAAAERAGIPDKVELRRELVKDDHVPFLEAGFAAVDLIDFEYGPAPGDNGWWHTPEDAMDKISAASLLAAGRLVCELVADLRPAPLAISRRFMYTTTPQ